MNWRNWIDLGSPDGILQESSEDVREEKRKLTPEEERMIEGAEVWDMMLRWY